MAEYDRNTRLAIRRQLQTRLNQKMEKLSGNDKELAKSLAENSGWNEKLQQIAGEFYRDPEKKPSGWFEKKGLLPMTHPRKAFLDVFVPAAYQSSYLYIIDKLNQFPFSRGWNRRTVRTAGYGPQIQTAFRLLTAYEKLFYLGEHLEDYILKRLDPEKLDYAKNDWNFQRDFSYVYAAEIDRGNQAVIGALKDLILSENNTAYLDREMILGILRSDNEELHELLCRLLLAARLQEGLRQVVCETMDEGTVSAFGKLLAVIEEQDLIRYSSVKRAVSTWIGIFDENNVDRVNGKLLRLMGQCLQDGDFCREQLKTNDSIAISAALWALGFREAQDAIGAMEQLVDFGTKNQKLTASYYNQNLYDESLKIRVAKKVILEHTEDLELTAAFMPAFRTRLSGQIRGLLSDGRAVFPTKTPRPKTPVLTDYFESREEAELLYEKFTMLYKSLPKKGVLYSPCIFPWYQVELTPSSVVSQLAFLAYVLQDEEKITAMAPLLGEVAGSSYDRSYLINLLLYEPKNRIQREALISYMGNGETYTSAKAVDLVKRMELAGEDYLLLEDMLRFKRSGLRSILIELLMGQKDAGMEACLKRLLADKKEEKRSAGLDMLLRLSKDEKRTDLYRQVRPLAERVENPTDKEQLLIAEICGAGEEAAEQKGYGIYDPDAAEELLAKTPEELTVEADPADLAARCLPLSEAALVEKIKKLDKLVAANKDYEYETSGGNKVLLGNQYTFTKDSTGQRGSFDSYRLENYPLAELFQKFYEEEIGDYAVLVQLEARMFLGNMEAYQAAEGFYKSVFGRLPFEDGALGLDYERQVRDIRLVYRFQYLERKQMFETGIRLVQLLTGLVNSKNKLVNYSYSGWNGRKYTASRRISEMPLFDRYFEGLKYWETDEEFVRAFYTAWEFEKKCRDEGELNQFWARANGPAVQNGTMTPMVPYWFLKAYHMGIISWDILIKAVLQYFPRGTSLKVLSRVEKGDCIKPLNRRIMNDFFGKKTADALYQEGEKALGADTWLGALIRRLYEQIIPVMVDTELRRGEAETVFSVNMYSIDYIRGIGYLKRILMALGKDTPGRESYYSWYYSNRSCTKREVLSHLLKSCYPADGETGADLKAALKGTKIKEERLVETAMYAPQWIDIIQEYLGWDGLKSGCYYFMAHMNERFDDQKKAIIARYTPLTPEELQDGAFDVDWFEEAYGLLGEKNFSLLYKAAKYISDGIKHSRARKYADAATGKVTLEELRKEITAKRNKDLLMSYGLVPFREEQDRDILERYQFIQQYQKESKQFGAQRRASEGKAAEIALVNLSVRAGFADVTRLTLNMEARLTEAYADYMQWTAVEDVELCLTVGEDGKSEILCRKNGKALKSIPSRLGKNAYVLEVKEAHKKLKDQYSRTRKLMEEAMEMGDGFTAGEVAGLLANPVVRAILKPLVYVSGEELGFVSLETPETASGAAAGRPGAAVLYLENMEGARKALAAEDPVRIAHPLDLYRSGCWHEYQKYLFDHQIRQPFKQVFRELYVKLEEELGLKASRMFAGNQIQPQKTVGCLKGRRWVADYEEGLQKIYYKENIVARIYALADWFSPSDVEAPTLEWVEFSNRKTFEPLTIGQVPDLIYSEVMRDVDLAVSVAHAGGVDPETSHSTIQMRRAIVEFNLPLFGLTNVVLTDSHALITGSRASYNVHLGSGVIHQEGGAMLHILPVHSQKRGRLFLPFVDEDPKTAEIMSKIVLLAEDKKIKDPFILDQIR